MHNKAHRMRGSEWPLGRESSEYAMVLMHRSECRGRRAAATERCCWFVVVRKVGLEWNEMRDFRMVRTE